MLKELIRYTEVADLKIISTFLNTQKSLPEAEALFSHVLNSQHIWISRIREVKPRYDRFHLQTKDQFKPIHLENIADMYELAATDLNFIVTYSNSEGGYFENKASDILYHLVNHSTYHRAQIATQFRLNGIQPPITDFIILKRENQL